MLTITHVVPPFRDYVKENLGGYVKRNKGSYLFGKYAPHLAIGSGGGVPIARVYEKGVVVLHKDFEDLFSRLATEFEKRYSTPDQKVTIKIDCLYEKPEEPAGSM